MDLGLPTSCRILGIEVYTMRYRTPKIPEMWARLVWCRAIFGEDSENVAWQRIRGRIYFRREQDLSWFMLRWC